MGQATGGPRRGAPRLFISLLAAATVVVLTATQANAAGPGTYTLIATGDAPFVELTTGNLVSGIADDGLFYLSTLGSGPTLLPFPIHLYDETYLNIAISTNGNIQPGATSRESTASFANDCLPSPSLLRPAILVFWDDLYFNTGDPGLGFPQGVFTSTTGSAPYRRFVVSWQGIALITGEPVLAQAIFQEGSPSVMFVYGSEGGGSATVGVQGRQRLTATQWTCTNEVDSSVSEGLRLRFEHSA